MCSLIHCNQLTIDYSRLRRRARIYSVSLSLEICTFIEFKGGSHDPKHLVITWEILIFISISPQNM